MIKYTSKYVYFLSFFITLLIFFILDNTFFSLKINKFDFNANFTTKQQQSFQNNNVLSQNVLIQDISEENEWYVEIPKIKLKANIAEGTTKEILDNYVGHFEETKKTDGNIGLAAHNRGYKNNYFSEIKKLREGDEIIYKYKKYEKKYVVEKNIIIKDTDWTNLENTEDNRITLITCVENEPEYRRCIQGVEY